MLCDQECQCNGISVVPVEIDGQSLKNIDNGDSFFDDDDKGITFEINGKEFEFNAQFREKCQKVLEKKVEGLNNLSNVMHYLMGEGGSPSVRCSKENCELAAQGDLVHRGFSDQGQLYKFFPRCFVLVNGDRYFQCTHVIHLGGDLFFLYDSNAGFLFLDREKLLKYIDFKMEENAREKGGECTEKNISVAEGVNPKYTKVEVLLKNQQKIVGDITHQNVKGELFKTVSDMIPQDRSEIDKITLINDSESKCEAVIYSFIRKEHGDGSYMDEVWFIDKAMVIPPRQDELLLIPVIVMGSDNPLIGLLLHNPQLIGQLLGRMSLSPSNNH